MKIISHSLDTFFLFSCFAFVCVIHITFELFLFDLNPKVGV